MSIYFHNEECRFQYEEKTKTKRWIRSILEGEKKKEGDINIIFSGNRKIIELNKTYLNRSYSTDVISFQYNEGETINGDVYIGIETVMNNAEKYNATLDDELHRIMAHGVLHLIGYDDKTAQQRKRMTEKEMFYLSAYKK